MARVEEDDILAPQGPIFDILGTLRARSNDDLSMPADDLSPAHEPRKAKRY